MANPNKPAPRHPYAEILEQQDAIKKMISEHLNSIQFRDLNHKLIHEYHGTLDYQDRHFDLSEKFLASENGRRKFFAMAEEHKTNKAGNFVRKNGTIFSWIVITGLVSALATIGIQNLWYYWSTSNSNESNISLISKSESSSSLTP